MTSLEEHVQSIASTLQVKKQTVAIFTPDKVYGIPAGLYEGPLWNVYAAHGLENIDEEVLRALRGPLSATQIDKAYLYVGDSTSIEAKRRVASAGYILKLALNPAAPGPLILIDHKNDQYERNYESSLPSELNAKLIRAPWETTQMSFELLVNAYLGPFLRCSKGGEK